jgi:Family of unknown function (DUF6655)
MRIRIGRTVLCLGLAVVACGCKTVREATPKSTATEELLMSTATSNALSGLSFSWLDGRKTFLEDKYFEGYDKGNIEGYDRANAVGAIRELLCANGALLVDKEQQADVVVEIRAPVLSMDNSSLIVGLPAMGLPVPMAAGLPVQTPELALFKYQWADSLAKFALFAYERPSGRYIRSVNPMSGNAYLHQYKLLFVPWTKTDVPELRHKHRKPAKQQN